MHKFLKKIFFVLILTVSMSMHANGTKKGDPIVSESKEENLKTEKSTVDYKDVQDVFMKIKRVDNILSPKKKLRKKKYTIA